MRIIFGVAEFCIANLKLKLKVQNINIDFQASMKHSNKSIISSKNKIKKPGSL